MLLRGRVFYSTIYDLVIATHEQQSMTSYSKNRPKYISPYTPTTEEIAATEKTSSSSKIRKSGQTTMESTRGSSLIQQTPRSTAKQTIKQPELSMSEKYAEAHRIMWGFDYEQLQSLKGCMELDMRSMENDNGRRTASEIDAVRADFTTYSRKVIPLLEAKRISDRIDTKDLKTHGYLKTRLERIEQYIKEQPKPAKVSALERSKGIEPTNLDHLKSLRRKEAEIIEESNRKAD